MKNVVLAFIAACVVAPPLSAQPAPPIADRAKGAETIVVAKVLQVTADFQKNSFGDQLIVSHALLEVEESLKGAPVSVMSIDVEGGSVGGLTLKVSDIEQLGVGDRAVFLIGRSPSGAHVPHQRGNGIIKLDGTNHVKGTNITLDEVKRQIQQGSR